MNYLLLDKPENFDTAFIAKKSKVPLVEFYTKRTKPVLLGMLCACVKLLFKSKKNDTIICWYDFQAVMCWWLCKMFFAERKIICINLLLKQKTTIKNRITTLLYKKALLSTNFVATVTSIEYGEWLNEKLGISVKYTLLRDVFHEYYIPNDLAQSEGYVFCGGNSERNWDLMYEVAKKMPQIEFVFVMSGATYEHYKNCQLDNVHLFGEMPMVDFMGKIYRSQIVCFPLCTEAPAGLTVMISAATNEKFIIMTDTPTTRGYIDEERGMLLDNNVEVWTNAIKKYFGNQAEMQMKAKNFSVFLKKECSEEKFVSILDKLIESNENTDCK